MNQQLLIIGIPYEKLLEDIATRFKEIQSPAKPLIADAESTEELLTRKQAAKLLGISLPTLHSWSLDNKLKAYYIGTRVRYKRNELMKALKHKPKTTL